jgi:hypothetical protein
MKYPSGKCRADFFAMNCPGRQRLNRLMLDCNKMASGFPMNGIFVIIFA